MSTARVSCYDSLSYSATILVVLQVFGCGIVLRYGGKFVIDGEELYEDVAGNVIMSFGDESYTIVICELISKKNSGFFR